MDHYEFRSWTAWHRHMFLVFIASAFLLDIRLLVIDKKSPILTLSMALMLVVAALSADGKMIKRALNRVDYHLRRNYSCLLYTSDAADEEDSVDLGGRRIIKKKKKKKKKSIN